MEFLLQKICACCSKNQLELFQHFLEEKKQLLSKKLIETLIKSPNKSVDYYCKSVYGNYSSETLKKFNQLNHHTLKYFSFVSQNFPSFLSNTINEIEELIFNEAFEKAITKIKRVTEVAKKLEDYATLIRLNEITQQNKLLSTSLKMQLNANNYAQAINLSNTVQTLILKQNLLTNNSISNKIINKTELNYFKSLFNAKSLSVKILAQQSYLQTISSYNDKSFYNSATLKLINDTKKLAENNSYLLIAHQREKLMSLDYMLVKHTRLTLNEKDMNKTCSSIINKWQKNYHVNNQLDSGLMLALSIKGSFFITDYYFKPIPLTLKKEIKEIILLLNDLEKLLDWEKVDYLKYINFYNVCAIFYILDNQEQKGIKVIEKVLHEYQQKTFKKMYDGIFVILIMAYYQAKDYNGVLENFNRYKKLTKTYVSVEENDLIIKALYYLAQLKLTQKNQYKIKLNETIVVLTNNPQMKSNLSLINRVKNSN